MSKSKKWFRNWSHSKVGNWETRKLASARNFSDTLQTPQARTFFEILRKYVKLNFRKLKVSAGLWPGPVLSY